MNKYGLIVLSLLSVSIAQAQLYNEGVLSVTGSGTGLYVGGNMTVAGSSCSIDQTGKTMLKGNFINNVTSGNVFTVRTGTFEFSGSTSAQHIRGSANKASNYIYFPNTVTINNTYTGHSNDSAVVVLDPLMGATVNNMTLTGGRFVLDSRVSGDKTDIAHLFVNGTITPNRTPTSRHQKGIIQVNLAMGDNADHGHLVGFSSPFATMYADYFFFNFMSEPTQESFFEGNKDIWNLDPKKAMPAGRGYVIGQGIVPHAPPHNQAGGYYDIKKNPVYNTADYAQVAKERFSFAREFMPSSFSTFNSAGDRFTGEALNTANVNVNITQGFNYLGNPFTVPLDMSSFCGDPRSGDWGTFDFDELDPALYILTPRSTGQTLNGTAFSFTTSYLLVQYVGSTIADEKILAPMQMFAIKKNTATPRTFILNASKRTHGSNQFLRSDESPVIDELLIETRDRETGGYDRLCVVFRNTATLKGDDRYDAEKLFNTTGGVNQAYTRSSDDINLITNVIPPSTTHLQMYFDPSSTEQQVELTADRIQSLQSVQSVILEDTKTGKKTDLMATPSYTFTSSPADHNERFILHFSKGPMSVDEIESTIPLNASYVNGAIHLRGLRDADSGQMASVYSMQGQLLHRQKIADVSSCILNRSLTAGIYVVRVDNNPKVVKLSVK